MIVASLRHGFSNILTFRGRTTRALFWTYVGILLGLATVIWIAVIVPEVAGTMSRMQRYAAEHPEQATVIQTPNNYSIAIEGHHPELSPDFGYLMTVIGVIAAIFVVLVAAAAVRRLHDADRTGWWGLPPLLFLMMGMIGGRYLFGSFHAGAEPDFRIFLALFVNNLVYLAALGALILQLCRKSAPGENRFDAAA